MPGQNVGDGADGAGLQRDANPMPVRVILDQLDYQREAFAPSHFVHFLPQLQEVASNGTPVRATKCCGGES
jgi:hypothetical protein